MPIGGPISIDRRSPVKGFSPFSMTRPLVRLLLVLLLLAALLWVWVAKSRPERGSKPGETAAQDGVSSRPEPRPGVPASAELLEEARSYLEGGGQEGDCGPYSRLSDASDPDLLISCQLLAAELDQIYAERLGVTPLGEPAAVIARSPTVTGATSIVSDPILTSSPISVRNFSNPL